MSNNTIPAAVIEANQFNEVEMPMEDVQARVDAWLAVISDVEQRGKLDRKDIGDFSVNGFEFVVATNSIMLVNRMIAVCTPANARMLTAYFKHFLPWKYDDEKKAFTTRLNAESKKFARKLEDWHAFRLDPSADVWTWFSSEKQKSKSEPKYLDNVTKYVKLAKEGNKAGEGQCDVKDIVAAVMAGGLSANDLLDHIDAIEADVQAKLAAEAEGQRLH